MVLNIPRVEVRSLIKLTGNNYEMGKQQGEYFKQFLEGFTDWVFQSDMVSRHVPSWIPNKFLLGIAKWYSKKKIESQLMKYCPNQLDFLRGIANGGNIDIRSLFIMIYAEGLFSKKKYTLKSQGTGNGCTSVAVAPEFTQSGGFLVGKNFDYNLEFQPLLLGRHLCYDNGAQILGHSGIGQAGTFHGMNNSGLVLSYDYAHPIDTNLEGIPTSILIQKALEECKSVEEVVYLFKNTPRSGGSIILVSYNDSNKAAVLECSATNMAVRWVVPGNGYIAATNHYLTEKMQAIDLPRDAVYDKNAEAYRQGRSISESSRIRYSDAMEILEMISRDQVGVDDVCKLLRHHHQDKRDYLSICCHDEPSHGTNMWAVFDPAKGSMYSAIDQPCVSKLEEFSFD